LDANDSLEDFEEPTTNLN